MTKWTWNNFIASSVYGKATTTNAINLAIQSQNENHKPGFSSIIYHTTTSDTHKLNTIEDTYKHKP